MFVFWGICCLCFSAYNTNAYSYQYPIDCAFSVWSEWRPHSDGQFEFRTRRIFRQARLGGQPCHGDTIEFRTRGDDPVIGSEEFMGNLLAGNAPSYSLGGGARYTLSRDIVLALDTTISSEIFPYYKSLVSNIVGKICGNVGNQPQDHRIHLATFDYSVTELKPFSDHRQREYIQDTILRMDRSSRDQSNLKVATNHARQQLIGDTTGIRLYNNATKEVLLVTSYREYCSQYFLSSADRLKVAAEVYVIVLGRGDTHRHPRDWCLERLASSPKETHLLQLDSVTEIAEESRILLAQFPINNFCQTHSG